MTGNQKYIACRCACGKSEAEYWAPALFIAIIVRPCCHIAGTPCLCAMLPIFLLLHHPPFCISRTCRQTWRFGTTWHVEHLRLTLHHPDVLAKVLRDVQQVPAIFWIALQTAQMLNFITLARSGGSRGPLRGTMRFSWRIATFFREFSEMTS